jgi:hypothetical protein
MWVGRRNKDDPTKDPPIPLGEVGVEKEHACFIEASTPTLKAYTEAANEFIWIDGVKSSSLTREFKPNARIIFGSGAVFIYKHKDSALTQSMADTPE